MVGKGRRGTNSLVFKENQALDLIPALPSELCQVIFLPVLQPHLF